MKTKTNMKKVWKVLSMMVAALAVYAGCANSPKSGGITALPFTPTNLAAAVTVGMNVCTSCHTGQTNQWIKGQHANMQSFRTATASIVDNGLNNTGFPFYAFADWNGTCVRCHDPLTDGTRLVASWTGNLPRPVIGCESCHGGGSNHFGIGPIPYPEPDHTRCGQCHNSSLPTDHLTSHPLGGNIVEEYSVSRHMASINTYTRSAGGGVTATCSRCHSDEGFKAYRAFIPGTADYATIAAALGGTPALSSVPVECHTCHDAHSANEYPFPTATSETRITSIESQLPIQNSSFDVNGKPQSREFNTCTSCHQLIGTDAKVIVNAFHDVDNISGLAGSITSSHAAVPGDIRLNTGPGELPLIMVKKGDANACTACHNPHSSSVVINEQWRESGHGDLFGDPWLHYNWDDTASRAACQRCHTSTGFSDMANNVAAYRPLNSNFSYLLPATAGNNGQNEVLYCWACHTNFKGALRDPGAFGPGNVASGGTVAVPTYTKYVDMANANIVFPDIEGSNVCLSCHAGRETGGNIYNDSTGVYSNASFRNSHYLASASIVFTAAGYEFIGRDYTDPTEYEHKNIGTAAAPGTGSQGPCVGCHMNTAEKHKFEPVARDPVTDAITAITSYTCAVCHTPGSEEGVMDVAALTEEEDLYADAMAALNDQLIAKRGFYFATSNPYFFKGVYDPTYVEAGACTKNIALRNWQTGGNQPTPGTCSIAPSPPAIATCCFGNSSSCGTCNGWAAATTPGTAGTGKDNMGAAFNYNLLEHEAAAFVHNRWYAKRLIYDSIDLIDDNTLNHSVVTTLNAYTTESFKAGAIAYLLTSPTCVGAACRP